MPMHNVFASIKTLLCVFQKGDRVVCCIPCGGYAEYVTCNADLVVPLPEALSFAQGAGLYIAYYTAYRALIMK